MRAAIRLWNPLAVRLGASMTLVAPAGQPGRCVFGDILRLLRVSQATAHGTLADPPSPICAPGCSRLLLTTPRQWAPNTRLSNAIRLKEVGVARLCTEAHFGKSAAYKHDISRARGVAGDQLREELKIKTRRSTLPNIFIGGVGIGGYSDGPGIYTLFKQGKLGDMLRKVGAL